MRAAVEHAGRSDVGRAPLTSLPSPVTRSLPRRALAALALAPLLAACGDPLHSDIVGEWERVAPTTGLQQRYTFSEDGAMAVRIKRPIGPGSNVEGTYEWADDSTVVLTYGTLAERFVAAVAADTLRLRPKTGEGGALLFTRATPPSN